MGCTNCSRSNTNIDKKGIIKGVVGKLAIHLQTPEQRKKCLKSKIYGLKKIKSESLVDIVSNKYGFD